MHSSWSSEVRLSPRDIPRLQVALLVRTFAGQRELFDLWAASVERYWPVNAWPVIAVLDAESPADRDFGAAMPAWVTVRYEPPPDPARVQHWRESRRGQLWSRGTRVLMPGP